MIAIIRRGTRRARFGPIFSAILALPILITGTAYADSANPPDTGSEGIEAESGEKGPIDDARFELEEAARKTGADGLATINIDYEANKLDLYWRGSLPAELNRAVGRVRSQFDVTVHDAPYTWDELEKEIRKVLDLFESDDRLKPVAALAMEPDISGIRVLLKEPTGDTKGPSEVMRETVRPSIPFRFVYKEWATNPMPIDGRWDDETPFTGGSVIQSSASRCTTAFTVRNSGDTQRGVLTAKHCGTNTDWFTASGLAYVGNSNLVYSDRDIMGIMWSRSHLLYPGFEGRIYLGPYTSSTKGAIYTSSQTAIGQLYCLSGGFSGISCSNEVIDRNLFYPNPIGGPIFVTEQYSGNAAAGNGDSGGPAYRIYNSKRYAKGVISAIDSNSIKPCHGMPSNPPFRVCSDVVLHVELQASLNQKGLSVLTAS